MPQNLRQLIKGDFFFSQDARDRFESEKGVRGLDDVLRKNSLRGLLLRRRKPVADFLGLFLMGNALSGRMQEL